MCHKVSRELWTLMDELSRGSPDTEAVPLRVVPLPSARERKAQEDAFDARQRQQRIIKELHEHPAEKRPGCGWGGTFYLRKEEDDGIKDALTRPYCNRHDCPWCWRGRITKNYRRAAKCVLYLPGKDRQVRVDFVHVGEIPSDDWEALNRKLRREHGTDLGRLHVDRDDGVTLVVSDAPFDGSEPLTPAQSLDRINTAMAHVSTEPSSYRQLGCWSDREEPTWKLMAHFEEAVDLQEVERALRELGRSCSKFKRRELNGRIWQCATEEEADSLFRQLQERCHFSTHSISRQKSDMPSDPSPEAGAPWHDVLTPFG